MTTHAFPQDERPRPLARCGFKTFRQIPTRWMDVDLYGHVNNVEYLSFFDTAVNGWYIDAGVLDLKTSETVFLVAETSCHYFAELLFPSVISAGLRVEKLGSSSVIFRVGLFSGDDQESAAHGKFVHIHVDRATRRPVPISDEKRQVLAALTAPDAD